MEAGIEHFGRGLEAGVDGVVSVVEPSKESIVLARKIKELTEASGAAFLGAIINRVTSEPQKESVVSALKDAGVSVIGSIEHEEAIQEACLAGKPVAGAVSRSQRRSIADKLLQK